MNSKQLANVLLKILGVSLCAHSVTALIAQVFNLLVLSHSMRGGMEGLQMLSILTGDIINFIIGVAVIMKSQPMAGWLLRDEKSAQEPNLP